MALIYANQNVRFASAYIQYRTISVEPWTQLIPLQQKLSQIIPYLYTYKNNSIYRVNSIFKIRFSNFDGTLFRLLF